MQTTMCYSSHSTEKMELVCRNGHMKKNDQAGTLWACSLLAKRPLKTASTTCATQQICLLVIKTQ